MAPRKSEAARQTRPPRRKPTPASSRTDCRLVLLAFLGLLVGIVYYYYHQGHLWSSPSDEPGLPVYPPYKVVDLPGKGKGLVATRDIEQGTLIIREKPLVLVAKTVTVSPSDVVASAVRNLTETQRRTFFDLSHVNAPSSPTEDDVALAIFLTNCVLAGPNSVGLFPLMARLNHACSQSFNVVYNWREEEGVVVVHALKPIKEGEELLTIYRDTKRPRDERRAILLMHYAFNCTCSTCTLSAEQSAASDARLVRMVQLKQDLGAWARGEIEGKTAIEIVRSIWDLGEEEGYWSERGQLAADAAWVAAAHTDDNATVEWATLAARWYGYELGEDSEFVSKMVRFVKVPQSHPMWGTRVRQNVGGPGHNNMYSK